MQIEEEGKYIEQGTVRYERVCGAKLNVTQTLKFRHPLGGERGVQRRRPRPERDNRGGSGCDEDERDKGIDNIIEVKKKEKKKV